MDGRGTRPLYEWDEQKSEENWRKHGLSFEDTRFDYGEERYLTFGFLDGRLVVIAHTPRSGNTRIISMRKANSREQQAYEERSTADRSDHG